MNRGIRAIIGKEFRHLRRDRMGLVYILLVPFMMIWLYGYGINLDVRNVRTAVVDYSGGPSADRLLRTMSGSGIFILERIPPLAGAPPPLETAERLLKAGKIREILVIPRDFEERISAGKAADIGVILDGSEANSAAFIGQIQERLIAEFRDGLAPARRPRVIQTRIAFNPDGRSAMSIIPGLFAIILMVISALLTSVAVARERETGAIDILLLSPLKSRNILLGKAIPYVLVAFFDGAMILLLARLWFHIPFRGNIVILALLSILYILTGVAMGVLISTAVTTQREATIAEVLTTLLPAFFLSGFILPLESLPPLLRGLSCLVPATYFIKIVKAIILKGAEFRSFIFDVAVLAGYAVAVFGLAVRIFSRRRESPR